MTVGDGETGPAWSSLVLRPRRKRAPRPVPLRALRAASAMRRRVDALRALPLYHELGTIRAAAVHLGLREEYLRDVLVEAGVHAPRSKRR